MAAPNFNPRRINGVWREGFALDVHTLSSEYVGDDEFGRPRFSNTYDFCISSSHVAIGQPSLR